MTLIKGSKKDKYDFPIGRIGNTKNPILIILLENQNSDPIHLKFNPEYVMDIENKFKPTNKNSHNDIMDFDTVVKYDKWWFELSEIWNESDIKISNKEVLALEYYPYATAKDNKEDEIYNIKWNSEYAIKSLEKNKTILANALKHNIPIFVYYKSGWYGRGVNDIDPVLILNQSIFISDYKKSKTVPPLIRKRLHEFLLDSKIQSKISELRKLNNYDLDS